LRWIAKGRMNSSKLAHPVAVGIFFILLFIPFPSIHAKEYYAFRVAGSDCSLCHNDPKTGSLNRTETLFEERGYRYPFAWKEVLFYFLSGLTLFFIAFGFYRRYRLWRPGRGNFEWSHLMERWEGVLSNVFAHRTILRSLFPGTSHLLLFWSLPILDLAVATILIQEYLAFPLLKMRFINSKTYPYLRLILDLFGMVGLSGTILLAYRRYIQRPKELDNQLTDAISLLLLFLSS
jgi:hypothetical protein